MFSIWFPKEKSNFIDICSMLNISVFILEKNSNHGNIFTKILKM